MNDFLQNLRNGQSEKQRPQKTRKSYDNSHHYSSSRFHAYGGYQHSRKQQQMKRPPIHTQGGKQTSPDDNLVTSMLSDAIETLSGHVEVLVKNQNDMIGVQKKTASMLEKQVDFVERIINHMNIAPLPSKTPEEKKEAVSSKNKKNTIKKIKSKKNTAQERKIKTGSTKDNRTRKYKTTEQKTEKQYKTFQKPAADKPLSGEEPDKNSVKPVISRTKKAVKKEIKETAPVKKKIIDRKATMDLIHTMREEGATYNEVAVKLVELGHPTFSGRGEWHAQTVHRLCSKKKKGVKKE